MAIQFFGQFLLSRGLITAQQLLEAVEYQEQQNSRAGSSEHLYFGQAVVQKGFANEEVIEAALAEHKEEQRKYERDAIEVPPDIPNAGAVADMLDLTSKMIEEQWRIKCKFGPPITGEREVYLSDLCVEIRFSGDLEMSYMLGVSLKVAAKGAKEALQTTALSRDDLRDLTREFANLVCGNMVVRLNQQGKRVEISTPTDLSRHHTLIDEFAVILTFVTPFGKVDAAVSYPV